MKRSLHKKIKLIFIFRNFLKICKSFSLISVPLLITGSFLICLSGYGIINIHEKLFACIILSLSLVIWIPVYSKIKESIFLVARSIDSIISSPGIVTAGTDILLNGNPQSTWGKFTVQYHDEILSKAKTLKLLPFRQLIYFIIVLISAITFFIVCKGGFYPKKKIESNFSPENFRKEQYLFKSADEEILRKFIKNIKHDITENSVPSHNAEIETLKSKILEVLKKFPQNNDDFESFLEEIDKIKKISGEMTSTLDENSKILEEMGKEMKGKIFSQMGKMLKEQKLDDASAEAQKIAKEFENSIPSNKIMEEASSDLQKAAKAGEEKLNEQSHEKEKGTEKTSEEENHKSTKTMENAKFEELKKTIKKLNELAKLFGIKSMNEIPEGLKDIASKFSDMQLDKKQAEELEKIIEKMDNLKNLMLESKESSIKNKYAEAKKNFEKQASGVSNEGTNNNTEKHTPKSEAENSKNMQKSDKSSEQTYGKLVTSEMEKQELENNFNKTSTEKATSIPKNETSSPSSLNQSTEGADSKDSLNGINWGTGTSPHLGKGLNDSEEEKFNNVEIQGKEKSGPIKKETIKGAAKKGFAGTNYKKVYGEYSSIVDEILNEEKVPGLYQYYVHKYFELIAPRNQ